jgi:hypothetical protein
MLGRHSTVVGDGSNILVNVITGRDVRFFGKGDAVRHFVNSRENVVVGISLLEMLKELAEERLDGVRQSIGDRANNFDMEGHFMVRGATIGHIKEGNGRSETGGRSRGRGIGTGIGAVIIGGILGGHRRVGVHRN